MNLQCLNCVCQQTQCTRVQDFICLRRHKRKFLLLVRMFDIEFSCMDRTGVSLCKLKEKKKISLAEIVQRAGGHTPQYITVVCKGS